MRQARHRKTVLVYKEHQDARPDSDIIQAMCQDQDKGHAPNLGLVGVYDCEPGDEGHAGAFNSGVDNS